MSGQTIIQKWPNDRSSHNEISLVPSQKQPQGAGATCPWVPREKRGRKGENAITEEITNRQRADEATSAVSSRQQGITEGARDGAERWKPEINRYLCENLVSNVEGQIDHWDGKAAPRQQPNPETARTLRTKAEGLGYALHCSVRSKLSFVN